MDTEGEMVRSAALSSLAAKTDLFYKYLFKQFVLLRKYGGQTF